MDKNKKEMKLEYYNRSSALVAHARMTAHSYLDTEGFEHACRVALYITDSPMIPQERKEECIALAYMHDLLEDTNYSISQESFLSGTLEMSLLLLTKSQQNEPYKEYIQRIRNGAREYPCAYWVKLADIKDHLTLTETLTERRKEKYLGALAILL